MPRKSKAEKPAASPGLAFRKVLVAFACAILATYAFVLPDLPADPTFMDLVQRTIEIGLLGASVLGVPVFMFWAASDAFGKRLDPGEVFKIHATIIMGFLLFETLRRLAYQAPPEEGDQLPVAYLTTFAQVIVGILIAFAAESFKGRQMSPEADTSTDN